MVRGMEVGVLLKSKRLKWMKWVVLQVICEGEHAMSLMLRTSASFIHRSSEFEVSQGRADETSQAITIIEFMFSTRIHYLNPKICSLLPDPFPWGLSYSDDPVAN